MRTPKNSSPATPWIIGTWSFAPVGVTPGLALLKAGCSSLDAVVEAATQIEADEDIRSVGVGGLPDADGQVSLDACVMLSPSQCGGVCTVRKFPCPTRIARMVMEQTKHVLLAGHGAEALAARNGILPSPLLTDPARHEWLKWRKDPALLDTDLYRGWIPPRNVEEKTIGDAQLSDAIPSDAHRSHDTVGLLALDKDGVLAGACSTSGMAFKAPGRVGDSPIIGQGLYVDDRVGAAVATGNGELISGVCGAFLAVEMMRQGHSPRLAATEVLRRVEDRFDLSPDHQVAMLAVNTDGEWASVALRPGFSHAVGDADGVRVEKAQLVLRDD